MATSLASGATSSMAEKDRLRVVIVGGAVAGLTLAHALHRGGIDFVVLEAHKEIAPQVRSSTAVLPNGARILDQMGIYDQVCTLLDPVGNALSWTHDGKLVVKTNAPALTEARYISLTASVRI